MPICLIQLLELTRLYGFGCGVLACNIYCLLNGTGSICDCVLLLRCGVASRGAYRNAQKRVRGIGHVGSSHISYVDAFPYLSVFTCAHNCSCLKRFIGFAALQR